MVVRYFRETHSGADYHQRGELQRALAGLEADEADVIVFYDVTRFSRDRAHQETIRRRIEAAGKRMAFVHMELRYDDDDELSEDSELSLAISGDISAHERRMIRRRMMNSHKKRASEGKQPAPARPPFGLHVLTKRDHYAGRCDAGQVGTYIIVEAEAAHVRQIFDDYAAGATLDRIARGLNARGIFTRAGKEWREAGVRAILTNTAYKGIATYGKRRSVRDDSRIARGLKTRTTRVMRDDSKVIYLSCPVIVTPELWERANARLSTARARNSGRRDRLYPLSGLMRCPRCGGVMYGKTVRRVRTEGRYYICRQSRQIGAGGGKPKAEFCSLGHLQAADVEELVFGELFRVLADTELLKAALAAQASLPAVRHDSGEVAAARERIAALEREETATVYAQIRAVSAGVDSAPYEAILRDLAAQKRVLREYLDSADRAASAKRAVPRQAADLKALLKPARRVLTSKTVPAGEKHDLLALIVESVKLRENDGALAAPEFVFVSDSSVK